MVIDENRSGIHRYYSCTAGNKVGKVESKLVNLDVKRMFNYNWLIIGTQKYTYTQQGTSPACSLRHQ